MTRRPSRVDLLGIAVMIALVALAIGQYLGWLDGPPPVLAPGRTGP
jgi:hypothetical protein